MYKRLLNKDECYAFNEARKAMSDFIKVIENRERVQNKLVSIRNELKMDDVVLVDRSGEDGNVETIFEPSIYRSCIDGVQKRLDNLNKVLERHKDDRTSTDNSHKSS